MGIISRARDALKRYRSIDLEEAYLNEATSTVDLENRQRELDRNRMRPRAGRWS